MTAAEHKFSEIEAALMRARDLGRVLRSVTDRSPERVDDALLGGFYILACEIETALDAAADTWTQAHAMAAGR